MNVKGVGRGEINICTTDMHSFNTRVLPALESVLADDKMMYIPSSYRYSGYYYNRYNSNGFEDSNNKARENKLSDCSGPAYTSSIDDYSRSIDSDVYNTSDNGVARRFSVDIDKRVQDRRLSELSVRSADDEHLSGKVMRLCIFQSIYHLIKFNSTVLDCLYIILSFSII